MPKLRPGQTVKRSINTRMGDELRGRLEAAAASRGVSLSREVEDRLLASFATSASADRRSPETADLLDSIEEAVRYAEWRPSTHGGPVTRWHEDPPTRFVARSAILELVRLAMGEDGTAIGELRRADGRVVHNFDRGLGIATEIMMAKLRAEGEALEARLSESKREKA